MAGNFIVEKESRRCCDPLLLAVMALLVGIGLTFLFSASYPNALRLSKSPEYFFFRQAVMVLLGGGLALLLAALPVEAIKKGVFAVVLVSIVLSIAVLLMGRDIQGARRWIVVGSRTFQPSELVKLAIILYLADVLSRKEEKLDDFYTLSHPIVMILLFAFLTFAQNDFSTSIFLVFVGASLLFVAGVKFRYLFSGVLAILPFLLVILFSREHRVKRLIAFFDPEKDPSGVGYQIIKAKDALVSGGFWGRGIGSGVKKFGTLPEAHSDFIFAVIGEEAGFIGIFIVIALFAVFAARGYMITFRSSDRFCFYAGFGITTSIFYQAIMNMAVVSGAIPATGVPLPFFSHGGSSILVTLVMCGILLNMSRYIKKEKAAEL